MEVITGVLALASCSWALTSIYQGTVYDNHTGDFQKCDTATVWSSAPYSMSAMTPQPGFDHGYYSIPAYPVPSAGSYKVSAQKSIGGHTYGACGWFDYDGENTTYNADLYMVKPPVSCPDNK
jgi:hypothetical protein